MKTIELKGVIKFQDWDGKSIYLVNGDDEIDLVNEFEEAAKTHGKEVQVNYWVSEKPCTKDEMLESWLKKVFGAIEAEYTEHFWGSWTYGAQSSYAEIETNGRLEIGGHDLFEELENSNGKFIIMELNFKNEKAI